MGKQRSNSSDPLVRRLYFWGRVTSEISMTIVPLATFIHEYKNYLKINVLDWMHFNQNTKHLRIGIVSLGYT